MADTSQVRSTSLKVAADNGDVEALLPPSPTVESTIPPQHSPSPSSTWLLFSYLTLNVVSSIGIVCVNKVLFKVFAFRCGTLLTMLHFIATFVGLEICRRFFKLFTVKSLPLRPVIALSTCFCGFVVLTNLSLLYNSVGFYQIMKVLTTPMVVMIDTIWYGQSFSMGLTLSLVVTCCGVAIATVSDAEANLIGTIFAISALGLTSVYQVWIKTKQRELQCNAYQLLYYQSAVSTLMLLPLIPFSDDLRGLARDGLSGAYAATRHAASGSHGTDHVSPSALAYTALAASCILAFLVNLSTFLVVGLTSAVTYNVLGHFKLALILTSSFVVFGAPVTVRGFVGIVLTLAGIVTYTSLRQQGQ